jgi:hypothetical protein
MREGRLRAQNIQYVWEKLKKKMCFLCVFRQPEKPSKEEQEAEMYEHVQDETSHADAQTLDVATDLQQKQQSIVGNPEEEEEQDMDQDEDVQMADDKVGENWQSFSIQCSLQVLV